MGQRTSAQQTATGEQVEAAASHAEKGMYAALTILTLIFLGINALGLMFGYKHCFYDEHSEEYYQLIKRHKEQRKVRARDTLYATQARQKVLKKSNQFFAKFQPYLVKQSRREGLDSLKDALYARRTYRMEDFVETEKQGAS